MAERILPYNHTLRRSFAGENRPDHVYRVNLYSSFTFNPTATTKTEAEVGCTQLVTGSGYVQNDKALSGVVVNITGNDCFFDADNVVWTPTGSGITGVWALIFNDSQVDDPPFLAVDFDGTKTAPAGTPFNIIWSADGLISVVTSVTP